MSVSVIKNNKSNLIKWSIVFILTAAIYLIPISEVFTASMRNFFAITVFIMAIVAFGFFDMAIPSFLLVSLYVIFEVAPASVVFSPWSGSTTLYMMIGAFVFANVLGECGLLKRVSYWTIIKLGGSFNGVVYAVYLAGVILALLTFHNGYILEVVLAYSVVTTLKLKQYSKEAALICCAGALGAYGLTPFVYAPTENGLIYGSIGALLPEITFEWYTRFIYAWPLFFVSLFTLWILTRIYKTKNFAMGDGLSGIKEEYKNMGKLSVAQKKAIFCTIILAAYLVLAPFHKLPTNYIFMTLPWLMIIPKFGIGSIQSFKDVYMGLMFFISGCMAIGSVGTYVGLGNLVTTVITPQLEGLNALPMMYAFLFVGTLANFALTPYAMLSTLSLPFCQLALDLGIDPMFSLMSLIVSTSVIFMPHEVACYAVLFGFGWVKMGDFIKTIGLYAVLICIFSGLVLYPYWSLLGLC